MNMTGPALHHFCAALTAAALFGAALPCAAEVTVKTSTSSPALLPEGAIDFQCWQEGEKIIDEKGLKAMKVSSELSAEVISFERASAGKQLVVIVSIGRSLCLAKSGAG